MKTIRIEYFGMDGEGETVKEAKLDAGRKISEALSRIGKVELVTMAGLTAILYGDKNGYSYKILFPDDPKNGRVWGCSSYGNDYDDTKTALRRHLASCTWTADMGTRHPELDEKENREFSTWAEWQLRYAAAKREGLSDEMARLKAA